MLVTHREGLERLRATSLLPGAARGAGPSSLCPAHQRPHVRLQVSSLTCLPTIGLQVLSEWQRERDKTVQGQLGNGGVFLDGGGGGLSSVPVL